MLRCNRPSKLGWSFTYTVAAKISNGGSPSVVIDEQARFCDRMGSERQVISAYPYGEGRREDRVVDAIHDAFEDFVRRASESGVYVVERLGPWGQMRWMVQGAALEDVVVRSLIANLAKIRRVSVKVVTAATEGGAK